MKNPHLEMRVVTEDSVHLIRKPVSRREDPNKVIFQEFSKWREAGHIAIEEAPDAYTIVPLNRVIKILTAVVFE